MALPSELRLKKRSDFDRLRKPRAVFPSEYLILKCAESEEETTSKFGFAVPKRLWPAISADTARTSSARKAKPQVIVNSVLRNRIRRILSEWVRSNIDEFPVGHLWLIIVKRLPEKRSELSAALRDDIAKLARKAMSELESR